MSNSIAILHIEGKDAKKFLQGQITCNVETLLSDKIQLAAHCNPQGRIISLFYIMEHATNYYLILPSSMAEIALAALKKYAVFYKLSFNILHDFALIPVLQSLDHESLFAEDIPCIYPETSGKFLPHDLNLPQLNAISFDKGCYTGQEIIARMHYRGKLKNHLYRATLTTDHPILPGMHIYVHDGVQKKIAGNVVKSIKNTLDLLIITDEANAKNNHLFVENNAPLFLTIKRKC